jgi:PglZ domain
MGTISQYLRELVARQIREHGIVVWFDPDEHFASFIEELELLETKVLRYRGSFFSLRHEIEPLIEGLEPPRLLVYVPLAESETQHALAEIAAAGVVMQPGQQPPTRNTRLSVLARNALKPIIGEQAALGIEKQVETKKLNLAELDRLAEEGVGVSAGVVSVIYDSANPMHVALTFLSSASQDSEVANKNAAGELAGLLHSAFGMELSADDPLASMRGRFARHVLATDFIGHFDGKLPDELLTVKSAPTPGTQEACMLLAQNWRNERPRRDSYIKHANQVEQELHIAQIQSDLARLTRIETFQEIEKALLKTVEANLLKDPEEKFVELARTRQSSFWSECVPDLQAHWALIAAAGQVLLEAGSIEQEMKALAPGFEIIFRAYTEGERPWCMLDTTHRHMERRWHSFDFEIGSRYKSLDQLVVKARQRYMEVGGKLSEAFLSRAQESGFHSPQIGLQTEIFARSVKPKLAEGKTAFIVVDALRYEMARELGESLSKEATLTLQGRIAAVPTITPIGMAALLPGAEESLIVKGVGEGQVGAEVAGVLLKDRKGRVNYLKEKAGVSVFEAKLEDLLPKPKKKTEEAIRGAQLIFITSQEIDALCEGDNISPARRLMDDILHDLRRACRILSDLDVKTIIFAADHGFLFGDELGSDMKIDPPGGETIDLHRRVWIGRGGTASQSYLRAKLSDFNIGGDLELASPVNFACFKVAGGAKAYFHGGLSPQEWIVPLIVLTAGKKAAPPTLGDIEWKLVPGSNKITTRFLSVQVMGNSAVLLQAAPPKVRVEVRVKSESLSIPVSSSYGFEEATGDVQLKFSESTPMSLEPNTITMMIKQAHAEKRVSIHLLDAVSGVELCRIQDIEMTISM